MQACPNSRTAHWFLNAGAPATSKRTANASTSVPLLCRIVHKRQALRQRIAVRGFTKRKTCIKHHSIESPGDQALARRPDEVAMKRILLAEDDNDMRQFLTRAL